MLWKVLIGVVGLFLVFRLWTFIFGNWKATLNRVITQYIAWKQMEPGYSDEQVFMAVLDHRYPERTGFISRRMYNRKNEAKEAMKAEIDGKMSVLNKYSLPILIYTCLAIEENSYVNSPKSVEELLEPITEEVKKQGFEKYC